MTKPVRTPPGKPQVRDPASEKARIHKLIDRLDEIGFVGEIEKYEPTEFPQRADVRCD